MCGYFCIVFYAFRKDLRIFFTNLFSVNNFKKYNFKLFYEQCLKMVEHDFHETPNMYPNLSANTSDEQQEIKRKKRIKLLC